MFAVPTNLFLCAAGRRNGAKSSLGPALLASFASLAAVAIALVSILASVAPATAQSASLVVTPTTLNPGRATTLRVSSQSELSQIDPSLVAIVPSDGTSVTGVGHPSPARLSVDVSVSVTAALGPRTLILFSPDRQVLGSAVLSVVVLPPECPGKEFCCKRNTVSGECDFCSREGKCPAPHCNDDKKCCQVDVNDSAHCLDCEPREAFCRPPD